MAHPRSRGENATHWAIAEIRAGSSPLTRGKLVGGETELSIPGLIPAHAGKTVGQGTPTVGHRAHPRSRGENRPYIGCRCDRPGSSPLTRGKRQEAEQLVLLGRLIPAHAGKTRFILIHNHYTRAHPRSRGENFVVCATAFVASGSSPLTRGKPTYAEEFFQCKGLIPAHAGKTVGEEKFHGRYPAHPRSRGENYLYTPTPTYLDGSSPLTRGKRRRCFVCTK